MKFYPDYVIIHMEDVWLDNNNSSLDVDLDAPFGHIDFFPHAPWYGTNVAVPTEITIAASEDKRIR